MRVCVPVRVYVVPPQLFMFKTEYCKVLCTKELSLNEVNAFVNRIRLDYHLNWCEPVPLRPSFVMCVHVCVFVSVCARV